MGEDVILQAALDRVVRVELLDGHGVGEELTVQLVRPAASDIGAGFLSVEAPLAQALIGKLLGATVAYRMGDIVSVRILAVTPAAQAADEGAAARRQAALDEARRKAEKTNAEMFAASYGSKWGGYDVE